MAFGVGDCRDLWGRERRPAVRKHKVQADTKIRKALRSTGGVGRGGARHHETGRGENAAAGGLFDGIVDGFVQTEVISRHYQIFLHCTR
jgi:hypothetical protein